MLQRRLIAFCSGLLFFLATHAQVNMQTGSATFSLPVFEWKDDKSRLSTNVALNYNSGSGLKVGEVASNVGQSWNLTAAGVITRMPLGEPDDQQASGSETNEHDLNKFPNGILYSYASNPPENGCPTALTRYPIYGGKNQKYKQHNAVAVDKQLDYFSFQFNGKSGMFVLNPAGNGECKMLQDSKMKVTFETDANRMQGLNIRTTIASFTIQDVDGLRYKFRLHGLTKVLESKFCDRNMTQTQDQPNFKSKGVYYQSGFENSDYVRPWVVENWYLEEVEDALTHRKIIFHYDINETLTTMGGADISYDSWHNYVIVTYKKSIEQVKLLTSIDCPDGHKVKLNYNNDRLDLKNDKVLTSIDVTYTALNKDNVSETRYLSRHQLNTSYFILNRYGTPYTALEKRWARLCLRSVKKIGPDLKEDAPPYSFDYYMGSNSMEDMVPPPFCVSHDIWGFYNGGETKGYNNEDIFPLFDYSSLGFDQLRGLCYLRSSGVVLNPKNGYAKNGLLKQIIYPTGGALSYEYAQNTGVFTDGSNPGMIGGVHVSTTRSTDGEYSNDCDHAITTQYNYVLGDPNGASSLWAIEKPDNTGEMTMNYAPEKRNYRWSLRKCHGSLFGCCYWAYQYPGIQSQPLAESLTGFQKFMLNAEPVMGYLSAAMTIVDIIVVCTASTGVGAIVALAIDVISSVLTTVLSCTSNDTKKGTSLSYYSYDLNGVSPLPMQFKRVEIVEGSGVNGRTVYEYTSKDEYGLWDMNNPNLTSKQRFAPWAYGLLKKITLYGTDGKKVRETENQYNYIKTPVVTTIGESPNPVPLASCKCNVKSVTSQRSDDWIKTENINANQTNSDNAMAVEIFPLYAGRAELVYTFERIYKKGDDNQYTENKTTFTYTPYYEVLGINTVTSEGYEKTKVMKYSGDLSGGIIDVMKQNNMISVPIASKEYTGAYGGNGYTFETVNEFTKTADGQIKVSRVLEQRTDRPTQTWTNYTGPTSTDYSRYKVTQLYNYDASGNLVTTKDEGGRSVATIYDHNDKYIVATVANAEAATDKPAYTSFETVSRGGWQLAASAAYDPNAVTGKWSLNLAGNSCTAPINNKSKAYILSFWANNGNVVVSTGATLLKSAPVVNGFTYYEYNIAAGTGSVTVSGNALIDELRLYPATARMNTITYDALIGKTSECDENNQVTYYEYDDLARLRFIKDENRNIVKMYEYNSVSKQNGCPATFYNQQIVQNFTKSNCTGDAIGGEVPYTIPANKYSSTISQADADAKAEMELMAEGQAKADREGECKPVYYNAGKSQTFETESCPDGYYGGPVTYTVEARKYSSTVPGEVEQMELDEIAANGQAYANDPAHANCIIDREPDWALIDNSPTECRVVNGEGHRFARFIDVNPNSPSYNTQEWQDTGADPNCPTIFYNADVSGNYTPTSCAAGWTPYPTYVSMPERSYTGNTQQEANDKARAAALAIANSRNSCVGPNVRVQFQAYPATSGTGYEVLLTNKVTGTTYKLLPLYTDIPEGIYDVSFRVWNTSVIHYLYEACGSRYASPSTIYNVPINAQCKSFIMQR